MTPARVRIPRHVVLPVLAAAAFYGALVLAILVRWHFDPSIFVVAGHRFVDPHATAAPILVTQRIGYDGQFYYRLAVAPWAWGSVSHGVRFDAAAYRSGRILYSALAWLLSAGQARAVPAALLALNMLGLAAVMVLTAMLTRSRACLALIVFCPGFAVTLTHDTTEIVGMAFLLAAVLARWRGRVTLATGLGAAAILTRETTALPLLGMLAAEACIARTRPRRLVGLALEAALLVGPCLLWRTGIGLGTGGLASFRSPDRNVGWPFLGLAFALPRDLLYPAAFFAPTPTLSLLRRLSDVATWGVVVLFATMVAKALPTVLRASPPVRSLAFSWVPLACLASTLTAFGPWIDQMGITRALTEFWVIGALLLAHAQPSRAALRTLGAGCGLLAVTSCFFLP